MADDNLSRVKLSLRHYLIIAIVNLGIASLLCYVVQSLLKITPPFDRLILWAGSILGLLIVTGILYLLAGDVIKSTVQELREDDKNALEQADSLMQANKEKDRLLALETQQRKLAQNINQAALSIGETLELNKVLDIICQEGIRIFEADAAYLWLVDRDDLVGYSVSGESDEEFVGLRYPLADPKLLGAGVIREHQPLIVNNASHSQMVDQKFVHLFNIQSMIGIPLIRDGRPVGALTVLNSKDPHHFHDQDTETAKFFAIFAVIAIGNAQLYEQTWRQVRQQRALNEIDRAISSSVDREVLLDVVLDQTIKQLKVDAASILLMNPVNNTLNYVSGKGFRTYKILHTYLPPEDEYAGRAVRENILVSAADIRDAQPPFERYSILESENFVSYFAAPMISKGKMIGVLEVFHRTKLHATEDWTSFLKTVAGQAMIAIENSALFLDLRKANLDLNKAYDATIAGWASALELRDRETQGHTKRVNRLFEALARSMGIKEDQLVSMRRGALLHDIGKMGIPDSILFKGDQLSEDEKKIMRHHPKYAYDMLLPIEYLRDSLDIPYCHHENWDGSGYPRGLKEQEIPLAARIFSVVDVYDALTTDRPYRKADLPKKALLYIRDQAGTQFDPQVVEAFINMGPDQLKELPMEPPNITP